MSDGEINKISDSSDSVTTQEHIKISPGAIVTDESQLMGVISVGSMTAIHPKASIIAEGGPVIIGEYNIIEEQASIIYRSSDDVEKENSVPLNIGVNNVFEVGCEVHAKSIGDHNVFESKCYVGPNVEVGHGCIIGAGCRVTVAEKLPDFTVMAGREFVRRVALDQPPGSEDLARQLDELTVMSEIFTKEEFSNYSTNNEVHAVFEAHIPLPSGFKLSLSQESGQTSFPISHLPSIRLVASFPKDYPSTSCPDFTLSCCWLSKSKLEMLVVELEKLWEENKCEILFIWGSFLKDQILELLGIESSYELSEKLIFPKSGDKEKLKVPNEQPSKTHPYHIQNEFSRGREIYKLTKEGYAQLKQYQNDTMKQLFFLIVSKAKEEFNKSTQICKVCYSSLFGEECSQLNCGHITCLNCLKCICKDNIQRGSMENLVCPHVGCDLELPPKLIKDLVSKELYERYDSLMLNRTLDKIAKYYCPQQACQYPVIVECEDSLAICPSCSFAFCVYCKRVWHGIESCKLETEEKAKLVEKYKSADGIKKQELEKRYGKKLLMELLNKEETEMWMSKNSKKCPCCNINIEKNDGCNKMICKKCKANFCWLCLTRVSSSNPYLHFQDPETQCFNLLFQGVVDPGFDFVPEDEEPENENLINQI